MRIAWLFVTVVCIPGVALGDDATRDRGDSNAVTAAPLGAAFRAFALEYERAALPHTSLFVEGAWLAGTDLPDTMAHAFTGGGIRVGARWFPWQRALRGAFIGVEIHGTLGTVDAPDGDYRGKALGASPQAGYSFVVWDRIALSVGLGLELNASNLENGMGDRALHLRAAPQPRANVGFAF
jgi:uncharacterized protein DUF3575